MLHARRAPLRKSILSILIFMGFSWAFVKYHITAALHLSRCFRRVAVRYQFGWSKPVNGYQHLDVAECQLAVVQ